MKKETTKCPICGRPTHKESKYCIFHASAEEKTEKEFKKAYEKYLDEIEIKKEKYNFEKFIFIGDEFNFGKNFNSLYYSVFNFKNAIFEGCTLFLEESFNGEVNFTNATFNREAQFTLSTFNHRTYFRNAVFNDKVSFAEVIFNGPVNFENANFNRQVDFIKAEFNYPTNFIEYNRDRI